MSLITWSDSLSVHVDVVDEQHKKLIALVNELFDAMTVGKGKFVLGKVLTELVNYTVYHFQTEERLFQQYAYPEYAKHKQEHDALTHQAKALKESFDQGNAALSIKVMNFLRDWLSTHILEEDKKFGPYLNQKGVR